MLIRTTIVVPPELSNVLQNFYEEFETEFGSFVHLSYFFIEHAREKYPDDILKIGSVVHYVKETTKTYAHTIDQVSFSDTSTEYQLEVPDDFSYQGVDLLVNEYLQDPKWSIPGSFKIEVLS